MTIRLMANRATDHRPQDRLSSGSITQPDVLHHRPHSIDTGQVTDIFLYKFLYLCSSRHGQMHDGRSRAVALQKHCS